MRNWNFVNIASIVPFLTQLLGLTGYCLVPELREWIIAVMPRVRLAACPRCGSSKLKLNGVITRTVRHVPVGSKHTRLKIIMPRMLCMAEKCGKSSTPSLPGVSSGGSITNDLAAVFLGLYASRQTFAEIALHTGASPSTVARWIQRLITALDAARPKILPPTIGIDEICMHDGADGLWTVMTDLETGDTIDVLPATNQDELEKFIRRQDDISQVTGISSDGAQHFIDFARKNFPHAVRTRDRFHIITDLLEALQRTRREAEKHKKMEMDTSNTDSDADADSDGDEEAI